MQLDWHPKAVFYMQIESITVHTWKDKSLLSEIVVLKFDYVISDGASECQYSLYHTYLMNMTIVTKYIQAVSGLSVSNP